MGARSWGRGNGELVLNRDRVSVWEDGIVLETNGGDVCTTGKCLMPLNSSLENG